MTLSKVAIHEKTFAMAWGDMDALGHVNHARFFEYFQEARIEWLAEFNVDLNQETGPVVVHAACTYLKPIVYPATLCLRTELHSLGRSSMVLDHLLFQGEVLMAQGTCKIVWVNYRQNKAVPFPGDIRRLFEQTK